MAQAFFGGVHPNDMKAATNEKAIEKLAAPAEVVIPMSCLLYTSKRRVHPVAHGAAAPLRHRGEENAVKLGAALAQPQLCLLYTSRCV